MATHLVWLRTDLRIHDNLALAAACRLPRSAGAGAGAVYRHPGAVA